MALQDKIKTPQTYTSTQCVHIYRTIYFMEKPEFITAFGEQGEQLAEHYWLKLHQVYNCNVQEFLQYTNEQPRTVLFDAAWQKHIKSDMSKRRAIRTA